MLWCQNFPSKNTSDVRLCWDNILKTITPKVFRVTEVDLKNIQGQQ